MYHTRTLNASTQILLISANKVFRFLKQIWIDVSKTEMLICFQSYGSLLFVVSLIPQKQLFNNNYKSLLLSLEPEVGLSTWHQSEEKITNLIRLTSSTLYR